MRLFTGVDLPEEIRNRLDVLISHLRNHAQLKWSAAYNLHVTTKFIGEFPQQRLHDLDEVLKGIQVTKPVHIHIRGLGWFPNATNPKVFWAGIEATPALAELARLTDVDLQALGVQAETRDYSPHLTLARIREAVTLDNLKNSIAHLTTADFGEFTPACFHLYRSETGHAGSVYSKLQEYALPTT